MISVIIPVYNNEKTIRQCLESVSNQSISDYEIIVIDSSKDNTTKMIKEFKNIKLIHLDEKTDPGKGRNIGVKEAKGDIIAFTDSDCIVDYDWLKNIQEAHKHHDIVGGPVLNGYKTTASWAAYFSEFSHMMPDKKKQVSHIPTCNISYKKKIFDEYGYFPEDIFPMEDRLFNGKLKNEKIIFDPKIRIKHFCIPNLKGFLKKQYQIGLIFSKSVIKFKTRDKKWLFPPLLLMFAFGRGGLYLFRTIKNIKYLPKFLLSFPYFLMGIFMFWIGAVNGITHGKKQP